MPLQPGDKAPDFTLIDQHGESFSLRSSLKERKASHLTAGTQQSRPQSRP